MTSTTQQDMRPITRLTVHLDQLQLAYLLTALASGIHLVTALGKVRSIGKITVAQTFCLQRP